MYITCDSQSFFVNTSANQRWSVAFFYTSEDDVWQKRTTRGLPVWHQTETKQAYSREHVGMRQLFLPPNCSYHHLWERCTHWPNVQRHKSDDITKRSVSVSISYYSKRFWCRRNDQTLSKFQARISVPGMCSRTTWSRPRPRPGIFEAKARK